MRKALTLATAAGVALVLAGVTPASAATAQTARAVSVNGKSLSGWKQDLRTTLHKGPLSLTNGCGTRTKVATRKSTYTVAAYSRFVDLNPAEGTVDNLAITTVLTESPEVAGTIVTNYRKAVRGCSHSTEPGLALTAAVGVAPALTGAKAGFLETDTITGVVDYETGPISVSGSMQSVVYQRGRAYVVVELVRSHVVLNQAGTPISSTLITSPATLRTLKCVGALSLKAMSKQTP